jgi:hypothetical protein
VDGEGEEDMDSAPMMRRERAQGYVYYGIVEVIQRGAEVAVEG